MRVFVCIKQVPDTETRIKLSSDKQSIDPTGIKWIINPYDEFAIEEAIRFKEAGSDIRITAVTIGPKARVNNALLTAMAMGADDALLINTSENLDANTSAKTLAEAIKKEGDASLIYCGKLAIDGNTAAVSQMLAEFLDIPHASVVSKIEYQSGHILAEREVEGGTRETFKLTLPALIAANKGLNKPRFPSLPGIMKAKKKPVVEVSLEELGIETTGVKVKFANYSLPEEKPPCKIIDGEPAAQVDELIQLLQNEAKII